MPDPEPPAAPDTLVFESSEALKSLEIKDGKARVGAYAIRFANAEEKDLTGDYFTKATNFGKRQGDGAPVLFNHGLLPDSLKAFSDLADMEFGEVKTRVDDVGLFAETVLDLSRKYEKTIADLCAKGALKWSSGAVSHMVRRAEDGHVKRWPVAEFSLTPTPVEFRAGKVLPLKSLPVDADLTDLAAALAVDTPNPAAHATTKSSITFPIMTADEQAAADKKALEDRDKAIATAIKSRGEEVNEILALASRFQCLPKAQEFIKDGKSLQDFNRFVLNDHLKPGKPVQFDSSIARDEGDAREVARFSVLKAVRDLATMGRLDGREKELSSEAEKHYKAEVKGLGFVIPDDVWRRPVSLMGHEVKSGNFAGTATAGGFLMQPELGPLIELLRNKPKVVESGATTLSGLVGDMYLPRQTAGATAQWASETGQLSDSNATFEQVKLTPKRLGTSIPYSNQFISQTGMDSESVIRNDAILQLSIAKDLAALHGTGVGGQPLGIANTPNIKTTVTYGGAAEWADVVQHETGIAAANADIGPMGFLLDASTVGKWKTIARATNYPLFLILDDMTANGFPVRKTNQISGSVSFFGVWSQLYLASWAGMRVIVDPYTLAKYDQVQVTFNELCDNCCRHPESFNVSTDSAAQ